VYPAEIERVLAGHSAVAMSAVGPILDEVKGELARAYVVLKPGMSATGGADRLLPAAPGRLQAAALRAARGRPAQDLYRQDHAARAEDAGLSGHESLIMTRGYGV
jgi:acyl-CoA synthetase (AMP-forming)/AMP-acid ligase II